MMNKDTKTLYDFIPNHPKGSTKPFIVKLGGKNTFDKISICEKDIISNLTNVYDPEIPVNIVDLGLIYSCELNDNETKGTDVKIKMTLTAPGCGMGDMIASEVKQKIEGVPGTQQVSVELVWDPPWDKDMVTEAAKLQLGML